MSVPKLRAFTTLAFALGVLALAGQTAAVETFDYAPGATLDAANGGRGWASPWILHRGSGSAGVTADSVGSARLGLATRPPAVRLAGAGDTEYRRSLGEVRTPAAGEFWVGLWLRVDGPTTDAVAHLALLDEAADTLRATRLQLGSNYGDGAAIVDGVGRYPQDLGGDARAGGWLVARVIPTGADQWRVYAWRDPAPGATAPDTATAVVRAMPIRANAIGTVALRLIGRGGLTATVDELRLASTFAELVPQQLNPYTPAAPPPAREDFAYAPGTELPGLAGGSGFDGPWRLVGGVAPRTAVRSMTLAAYDTTVTVAGVALDLAVAGGGARVERPLARPFDSRVDTFWAGALFVAELGPEGRNVASVVLAGPGFGPSGPAGQPILFGKGFATDRVSFGPPSLTERGRSGIGEAHFVALRLERGTGAGGRDRAWLFVDPPRDRAPDLATAEATLDLDLGTAITALGLKVEGQPGLGAFVGALAVADAYRDVVPTSLRPAGVSAIGWGSAAADAGASLRVWPQPVGPATRLEVVSAEEPLVLLGPAPLIRIFDATGRLVAARGLDAAGFAERRLPNLGEIGDVAAWPPGVYVVELRGERLVLTQTFVR